MKKRRFFRSARFLAAAAGLVLLLAISVLTWGPAENEAATTIIPPEPSEDALASQPIRPALSGPSNEASGVPARVRVGGVVHALRANPRGEYPRLAVAALAVVEMSVPFPGLAPGARVAVGALDGGILDGTESGSLTLNDEGRAEFSFQLPHHEGAHRVRIRYGDEIRTFEYWVGEEPPVVVRR